MELQISDELLDVAKKAMVRLGRGRGFIVEEERFEERRVITAAHCLPHIPETDDRTECTYADLISPLEEPSSAWSTCLFVDPVGDIAVLGPPDSDSDELEKYDNLVLNAATLQLSDSLTEVHAWVLSLDNEPIKCDVKFPGKDPPGMSKPETRDSLLFLTNASERLVRGMSGSPILSPDGKAIGVLALSDPNKEFTESGPNPRISTYLPPRLLIGHPPE